MVVFDSSLVVLETIQVNSGSHRDMSYEEYHWLNVNSQGLKFSSRDLD